MNGASRLLILAAGLAFAVAENRAAWAQTPPTIEASEMARRLDTLSKLVGRYASLTKSIDSKAIVKDAAKADVGGPFRERPTFDGLQETFASAVLSKNLSAVLDEQRKQADSAAIVLANAAQDARSSDGGATKMRLDSILAPQVVIDLFTTTSSGEELPLPPHLEGAATPSYTLGDFVVGPGSSATVAYPSIASINYRFEGYGSSTTCTGTLISAEYVLTAAHCFCDNAHVDNAAACRTAHYKRKQEDLSVLDPRYVSVFFQDTGVRSVKHIEIAPTYAKPVADLAVLELAEPERGIAPAPLQTKRESGVLPLSVVVGFGEHGPLARDARPLVPPIPQPNSQGIKMFAYVRPEACKGDDAGKGLVCWHAVKTAGAQAHGTTCHGDSGGPLFTKVAGRWLLSAVTSGGPKTCLLGGSDDERHQTVNVSVGANFSWIKGFLKDIASPPPPGTPFVADPTARVYDAKYRVFFNPFDRWSDTFVLEGTRSKLIIAVNGNPTFSKLGVSLLAPDTGASACQGETDDSVIVCDVPHPSPGKWTLNVTGSRPQETQVVGSVTP